VSLRRYAAGVATFSPTSVFPTGNSRQKDDGLFTFERDRFDISSTATDVTFRFFAPGIMPGDIESTVCLEYSARAASMIVGVGW